MQITGDLGETRGDVNTDQLSRVLVPDCLGSATTPGLWSSGRCRPGRRLRVFVAAQGRRCQPWAARIPTAPKSLTNTLPRRSNFATPPEAPQRVGTVDALRRRMSWRVGPTERSPDSPAVLVRRVRPQLTATKAIYFRSFWISVSRSKWRHNRRSRISSDARQRGMLRYAPASCINASPTSPCSSPLPKSAKE